MAKHALKPLTSLGYDMPKTLNIGAYKITEVFDVALASLATRKGREKDVLKAAKVAKIPLPSPSQADVSKSVFGAFWLSVDQWMIETAFESHEDIAAHLKSVFGDAASITEQTDAWVRFDVSAAQLAPLFEKLCNVDLQTANPGFATRTVIEHLGCYLIKRSNLEVSLYGPRSSATSLLHALEITAQSLI